MLTPCAQANAIASAGASSISHEIFSLTSTAFSGEYFTSISPTVSYFSLVTLNFISAPIFCKILKASMRVLFSKMFFSVTQEPGVIHAATAKKNAELGSFGTSMSSGASGALIGATSIFGPLVLISAPIPFSIRSV